MRKWVEKLVDQFDFDWKDKNGKPTEGIAGISEERATLLYIIDTYQKHLVELEGHPVRKTRETLDDYVKEILAPRHQSLEKVLFRFRQFFSAYRIDEYAYFQKTFEDFRTIIWDFVDQLAEDVGEEQKEDFEIRQSLEGLREAVESNSIPALKNQSRKFIDCYVEKQFKRDKRRSSKMKSIRKNLHAVKKQLGEATSSLRIDHMTNAFNRKTFDEYTLQHMKLFKASGQPCSLMLVDIDHFKKINDNYGHPVGDFVLKELVGSLKAMFDRDADMVCRIGGEEFAIILPDLMTTQVSQMADELLAKVRKEVFVHEDRQIKFTVSIGVAHLTPNESVEDWVKRADQALYYSKNNGRNRATIAAAPASIRVA